MSGVVTTAFREYSPDTNLVAADWTNRWATWTTETTVEGGSFSEPYVRIGRTAGGFGLLSWDALDTDADRATVDLVLRVWGHPYSTGAAGTFVIRGSGALSAETHYLLYFGSVGARVYVRSGGGGFTLLGTATGLPSRFLVAGEPTLIRWQFIGSACKVRGWLDGTTEPTAWNLEFTDATISAAGWIGFSRSTAADYDGFDCDYLSVGTGSSAGTVPSAWSRSRRALAQAPGVPMEWVLKQAATDSSGNEQAIRISSDGRGTDATDYPASTSLGAQLIDAVAGSVGMAGDLDFDDEGSAHTVSLRDGRVTADGVSVLVTAFDGLRIAGHVGTLCVGERDSASLRAFDVVSSARASREPSFSDSGLVALEYSPSDSRLNDHLPVRTYIGLRDCKRTKTASGGTLTIPSNAAYDVLTSFTLLVRLCYESAPGSYTIINKDLGSTDQNFWLAVPNASGQIQFSCSAAGVSKLTTGPAMSWVANKWGWAGVTLEENSTLRLVANGAVLVDSTIDYTPDTQASPIVVDMNNVGSQLSEIHLFARALSIEEMVAMMAGTADDVSALPSGLVGWWKCNDATGSTATDYATAANHGTFAATKDTHWEWWPTYSGELQQAGQPMPIAVGEVAHLPAQMCDSVREAYRFSDGTISWADWDQDLFAAGVSVTMSEPRDGVLQASGAIAEPVSASCGATDVARPMITDEVVTELLSRATYTAAEISAEFDARAPSVLGGAAGWASAGQSTTLGDALRSVIGGVGGHWRFDRRGRFIADRLLAPAGSGPMGLASLESGGDSRHGNIVVGGVTTVGTTSVTLMGWVKVTSLSRNWALGLLTSPLGAQVFAHQHALSISNTDGRVVFLATSGISSDYLQSTRSVADGRWWFIAGVYDSVAGTRKILMAPESDVPVVDASETGLTGTPGGFSPTEVYISTELVGNIQYLASFSAALSTATIQGYAETPPTTASSNIATLIKLDQGSGYIVESKSGGCAPLIGCRWSPVIVFDLDDTDSEVEVAEVRRVLPAEVVRVTYDRNYSQLSHEDLDASVSQSNAIFFRRPHQTLETVRQVSSSARGRVITLDSPLTGRSHAQALASSVLSRMSSARRVVSLSNVGRKALAIEPNAEIRLTCSRYGIAAEHFRVVGVASTGIDSTGEPRYSMTLWG